MNYFFFKRIKLKNIEIIKMQILNMIFEKQLM